MKNKTFDFVMRPVMKWPVMVFLNLWGIKISTQSNRIYVTSKATSFWEYIINTVMMQIIISSRKISSKRKHKYW